METKIVTCLEGEILDIAVDLRRESPTFLSWVGVRLSGNGGTSLVIPEGCAHGFQVLSSEAVIIYFHTEVYHPEVEGRVNPLDPALAICWELPVSNLSDKDRNCAFISSDFVGL